MLTEISLNTSQQLSIVNFLLCRIVIPWLQGFIITMSTTSNRSQGCRRLLDRKSDLFTMFSFQRL